MGMPAVAPPPAATPSTPPVSAAPTSAPATPAAPSSTADAPPESPPAAATPAAPEQPGLDLPTSPPPVPYGRFKEERRRLNGQIAELRQKVAAQQQLEQRVAEMQRRLETQQQAAQHFEALSRVIRTDRELAARIESMIGELPADPAERQAVVAQLPAELQKGLTALERLEQRAAQQEQRQRAQVEQRELEETRQELHGTFKEILEKRGLPVAEFTPLLESYVFHRLRQMGDEADFEDVPFIVAEFLKPVLSWHHAKLATLGTGKLADAALPVNPSGSPPIHAAPTKHALDSNTNKLAESFLRGRGWAA